MRICIFVTVLVFAAVTAADAADVRWGVKAGPSISTQDIELPSEDLGLLPPPVSGVGKNFSTDSIVGVDVGVYIGLLTEKYFGLLLEARYVQKGMTEVRKNPPNTVITTDTTTIRLQNRVDYLSFPLLFEVNSATQPVVFYLAAGPRLDLHIGHADARDLEGDSKWGEIYKDFRKVDWGATLVAGVSFWRFLVEFDYSPNLTDSYDRQGLKIRNESMSILVGVRL